MDGSFGPDGFGRTERPIERLPAAAEREWSLSAGQVAAVVAAIVLACWAFASLS